VVTAYGWIAAFAFIEPLLSTALGVRATVISTLLLIFGIAGVIGNFISGKLIDRYLKRLVLLSLALMAASVLVIGNLSAGSSTWVVGALLLGWGAGVAIVFVGLQTWILRMAGQAAMPASAIYVAIFNAAIGAGALLGGIVLSMTNLNGLMLIASLAMAISLLPVMLIKPPTS